MIERILKSLLASSATKSLVKALKRFDTCVSWALSRDWRAVNTSR